MSKDQNGGNREEVPKVQHGGRHTQGRSFNLTFGGDIGGRVKSLPRTIRVGIISF